MNEIINPDQIFQASEVTVGIEADQLNHLNFLFRNQVQDLTFIDYGTRFSANKFWWLIRLIKDQPRTFTVVISQLDLPDAASPT